MKRTARALIVLALAVPLCFVLASLAQAGPDDPLTQGQAVNALRNTARATSLPIWQITKEGSASSVRWESHTPNPRFAIYDNESPGDPTDDLVVDKETGLVWERAPSTAFMDWYTAIHEARKKEVGGRMAFRLPTVEELSSLIFIAAGAETSLDEGHPFIVPQPPDPPRYYWSETAGSTAEAPELSLAYGVKYYGEGPALSLMEVPTLNSVWVVRGETCGGGGGGGR
jgi:hypothetical protein